MVGFPRKAKCQRNKVFFVQERKPKIVLTIGNRTPFAITLRPGALNWK